jgi:hypothetical protein
MQPITRQTHHIIEFFHTSRAFSAKLESLPCRYRLNKSQVSILSKKCGVLTFTETLCKLCKRGVLGYSIKALSNDLGSFRFVILQ